MCGIIGIVQKESKVITQEALNFLERLEYRGYDSAGMVFVNHQSFVRERVAGRVSQLKQALKDYKEPTHLVLGHTRWATHGGVAEKNAHPFMSKTIALVHNGIIENFYALKQDLQAKGYEFTSDTDTEVALHLIEDYVNKGLDFETALRLATLDLKGRFALVVISLSEPNKLFVVKKGASLSLGLKKSSLGLEAIYVSSDTQSLLAHIDEIAQVEEGHLYSLSIKALKAVDLFTGQETPLSFSTVNKNDIAKIELGTFDHYMIKEIHDQKELVRFNIERLFDYTNYQSKLTTAYDPNLLNTLHSIKIVGAGTAYYAGYIAKYWIEKILPLNAEAEIASEIKYRKAFIHPNTYAWFVSQSGETLDVMVALEYIQQHKVATLAVVNVPYSSLTKMTQEVCYINAGVEVCVASTKVFTGQLLALLANIMRLRDTAQLPLTESVKEFYQELAHFSAKFNSVYSLEQSIKESAYAIIQAKRVLFLGRDTLYPLALEGALKFKELTYLSTLGIALGELKHGSIALIDTETTVVILVQDGDLFEKTLSNIQEIHARKGKILIICSESKADFLRPFADSLFTIPETHEWLQPLLMTVPLQLLAYHSAKFLGLDIDKPRNLAKSVTVE